MATEPPSTRTSGMIERIKAILLKPKEEWPRIEAEPATVAGLMTGWVLPLAAIGPLAGLIASLAFGYSMLGVTYRPSVSFAVSTAASAYIVSVLGTFVLALVINALAPSFGATKNSVQAMKVAAYASTASYLAGIFQILPPIAWLGILGIYSLYLFWIGLPILMKPPTDRAGSYALVTIGAAILVFIVAGAVAAAVTTAFAPRPAIPTITFPS